MGMLESISRAVGFNPQQQKPAQGNGQGGNFKPDSNQGNMQFQPGTQQNGADMQSKGPQSATVPNAEGNNGQPGNGNAVPPEPDLGDMAKFGNIFDNSNNKPDAAPKFALDGKTLDSVASSQDFFQGIDPAILAAADSGDAKAMREVMQAGMRNAYKAALQHGGTLTDNFVTQREEHQSKGFGKRVKSELTAASMASHPAMKNPVIRQQMNETAQRLSVQHPDASPEEIKGMTMEYFTAIAGAFAEKKPGEESNEKKGDADFSQWFGDGESQSPQRSTNYFN